MSSPAPAVVVLGQTAVSTARQLMTVLPGSRLYGLVGRTTGVDIPFTDFGTTLRELFAIGTPLIGICATGILIRTLAPLLTDKFQEPPVIAVAEDGTVVVPLLGGLQGVNDLARQISIALGTTAAITTTGDIRFRTALLAPPPGYHLANPEDAKGFIADLLAGATVHLEGTAPWLEQSRLPIAPEGPLTLRVTTQAVAAEPHCLVYHPATLAVGFSRISISEPIPEPEATVQFLRQILAQASLTPAALAGIFACDREMADPAIEAIARAFQIPARFLMLPAAEDRPLAEQLAHLATGPSGQLLIPMHRQDGVALAIAAAPLPFDPQEIGHSRGRLAIVGTGPGGPQWMSPEVRDLLQTATDLVGYRFYLDLAGPLQPGQQRHEFDNREELDRARWALDLAATGRSVVLVSSGDPGIYAMAAAVFEVLDQTVNSAWEGVEIQVAPGISAIQAAAALAGAPIGHDFCAISLSDILKPWSVIEHRITTAAVADLVIAFYNPASRERSWQLTRAQEILLQQRSPQTPVVLGRDLGRPGQSVRVVTLEALNPAEVDMRTLVLVGSSHTRLLSDKYGKTWVYTPRRYDPIEVKGECDGLTRPSLQGYPVPPLPLATSDDGPSPQGDPAHGQL
ncbi:precorrin-3B C(17)-methyltransferase [Leptolyngbya sp. 'hensonii']|nr:precorrin-3B C(17)-methyltransferase [Leptolyngbya sp. 'hensonii']OLP17315.1 precorrin-3B C(17)-methyltransferase [Leptolyngbya sp. 'hensonii']